MLAPPWRICASFRSAITALAITVAAPFAHAVSGDVDLVEAGAELFFRIPVDGSEDASWRELDFDDSSWVAGNLGLGFDSGPSYAPFIATDVVATIPLKYNTSTRPNQGSLQTANFTIPRNTWLGGKVFYTQPISLDTHKTTKLPMIHSGWASKWTIGTGIGAPAATLYRTGDNSQPTGFIRRQEAPSIRLNQ